MGTLIGEVLELGRSGRGRGVPGGGSGRPRPIGCSGVPARSVPDVPSAAIFCSALRLRTPQPHFFAAAVAFPIDGMDDLLSEGASVRATDCRADRFWSFMNPDLVEVVPVLLGVPGGAWLELPNEDVTTVSCMLSPPVREVDEELPLLLISANVDGREGDPTGVSVGDAGCERLVIAIIELAAPFCSLYLVSVFTESIFAVSVVTTGLAAAANECDRIAFGGCDRFCTPVEDAPPV